MCALRVGITAFLWALWDFQVRNRQLRDRRAMQYWAERTHGAWDLRYLALGLEAANVANVLGGMFYASLFMPWFYIVWIVNRMLWALSRPSEDGTARPHQRASHAQRRGLTTHDRPQGASPQHP